jgi:hypothetical protein
MMKKFSLMLALVVLLGVFAAACGEGEDETYATVGFTIQAGQELYFYEETGKFVYTTYNASREVNNKWEGTFSDDKAGLVTMSGVSRTQGTFDTALTGWTFAYAGDDVFTSTGSYVFTFNAGSNVVNQGIVKITTAVPAS